MSTDALVESASHTIGPFFHVGLPWKDGADVAGPHTEGRRLTLIVHVLDRDGTAVDDAMLETWQADAQGCYAHPEDARQGPRDPGFVGFSRTEADAAGCHTIRTVLPGRVPGPGNSLQAAHLNVSVFGRGLMQRLVTRVYFAGEPGLDEDPILALVPPDRHGTLLARPDADGATWRWHIRLRGEAETVFFDI